MMATGPIKTYTEMLQYTTFEDRFNYLKLDGRIGEETFGNYSRRWLNQRFYQSPEWQMIKQQVLIRDNGCDMALQEYELINNKIYVHHMNPITEDDIINHTSFLTNPEYLVCVSFETHNAIHFGDLNVARIAKDPAQRYPGDQCLWR